MGILSVKYFSERQSGTNKVQTPHTTSRLKILEPTALLMARELLPVREAVTLTAHSGRLVPMATMVMPMIMEGDPEPLCYGRTAFYKEVGTFDQQDKSDD